MRRRWATAAPAAFATPVVGGAVAVVSLPRRTPGTAAAALAAPTATDALAKSRRLTFLLIRSSLSTRRRSSILRGDATDPQRNSASRSGRFSPSPDGPRGPLSRPERQHDIPRRPAQNGVPRAHVDHPVGDRDATGSPDRAAPSRDAIDRGRKVPGRVVFPQDLAVARRVRAHHTI